MQGPGVEFDWKFTGQISMFGVAVIIVLTTLLYACEEPKPQNPKTPKPL
jgi:hypothetical protein